MHTGDTSYCIVCSLLAFASLPRVNFHGRAGELPLWFLYTPSLTVIGTSEGHYLWELKSTYQLCTTSKWGASLPSGTLYNISPSLPPLLIVADAGVIATGSCTRTGGALPVLIKLQVTNKKIVNIDPTTVSLVASFQTVKRP